jgi:hypothetical protein
VKVATPEELAGVDFGDYDVVVLAGAPYLNDTYLSRLKFFVRRGRSLFITYGGRTDIESFNRDWSEPASVVYDQAVRTDFSRAGYYSFQTVDLDHPIFSVFSFEDSEPPEVKFYTLPRLHVSERARILMSFTGDRPALVESGYGSGKVMTFTGPVSPEYSDLVSHGFFVPFVSRIAEFLASDLSSLEVRLYAGRNITRALSTSGSEIYSVDMLSPDSTIVAIPPEEDNGALIVRTGPLTREGIYSISARGREIDRFAVNIDPTECNLASADPDQFAAALGASEIRQLEVNQPLAKTISQFRIGRELWQVFLWIAVGLLAVEMLLGRGSAAEE